MNTLTKLLSGRFLLTLACAIVFVEVSIRGMLSSEAVAAILVATFKDYFNRQDRINQQQKENEDRINQQQKENEDRINQQQKENE